MTTSLKSHYFFAVIAGPDSASQICKRHAHRFSFWFHTDLILPFTRPGIIVDVDNARILNKPLLAPLNGLLQLTNRLRVTPRQEFKLNGLPTRSNIFRSINKAFHAGKATRCQSPITYKLLACDISTFTINKLNCYSPYMAPTNPSIWTDLTPGSHLPD